MWQEIIQFWFEEVEPKQKYKKDPEFDELIRTRFGQLFEEVAAGEHKNWRKDPEGRLAEVIVLDQFSRNLFRDDARAFAYDSLALKLAQEAVEVGDDQKLDSDRKRFALYMPYMHSESKDAHVEGLKLFEAVGDPKYMLSHKKIIDRFGRYPHRNEVLGRESTPEEVEFNKEHGGF